MLRLAWPVVLAELGWMLQGVVDVIMVGRLGPVAIGAVALGNALYYAPSLFGLGLMLAWAGHRDCARLRAWRS
jgi:MATE family multidrug resistance protein